MCSVELEATISMLLKLNNNYVGDDTGAANGVEVVLFIISVS